MTVSIAGCRRALTHPVLLTSLIVAFCIQAYAFLDLRGAPPIRSDGWGYYVMLPAVFVYGDPHLAFLGQPDLPRDVAQYRFPDGTFQGISPAATGFRDKYAFGVAVMQLPFFLVALAAAKLALPTVNGFEWPFQVANAVSGAFYFALGAYLAYRAARLRYDRTAALAAVGFAALATNLLFYGSFEASFSHVYGFCLIAGLVYLTLRRADSGGTPRLEEFALFGLLIGLAVIVRPTNAVTALLYLIFIRRADPRRIVVGSLLSFAAAVVAASPQMLLWLLTSGRLIYYSYVGEGFNFLRPTLRSYLTGTRKGVFFWHPAYLAMIVSLAAQIGARTFETIVMLTVVALNIYSGASWGDPAFGDSFGCRQIVEMNPILIPSTAAAASWLMASAPRRWAAATLGLLLITLNAVQSYGYMIGTVPHNNTTLASYKRFWSDPFGLRR